MGELVSIAPAADARRVAALDRLDLASLPADDVLDGLVRAAARSLRCPAAMVNLIGADAAWSVASTDGQRSWLPRELAFCNTVVSDRQPLMLGDLQADTRFAQHPLVVGEPGLRCYAGVPVGDGVEVLGSLCVLDTSEHAFDAGDHEALVDLGRAVSQWLSLRRVRSERLAQTAQQRDRLATLVARRTAELELARQSAEAASAAKSTYLATMSHEIRTPLNGVLGLIELVDRSGLPGPQQELLHTARDSARALLGLIDDVLDFAKIEAGRLVIHEAPLDLSSLIERCAEGHLGSALAHRVRLQVFVDPGLATQRMGDALRLRQVLGNLVSNAIKFAGGRDRDGWVRVRARAVDSDEVFVEVCDNGPGLDADTVARLFQPFVQAEASTSLHFGGTGLGLSISQRLAQAMGGCIDVRSERGAGACFTLQVPLRHPMPALADGVSEPAAPALAGVSCCWLQAPAVCADDLARYLSAEGAQWVDMPPGPVAPCPAGADGLLQVVRDGRAAWIALCHGQRRAAQAMGDGIWRLDVDALRRQVLVETVLRALTPTEPLAELPPTSRRSAPLLSTVRPVLVAEDNPVNRYVIAHQLQHLGVPHELAVDGEEALAMWSRDPGRYSLLLTDLHMPGLGGHGLVSAILDRERATRLPVVALTADVVDGEAERALAAGMDDYLTKPIELDRLAQALQRWIGADAGSPAIPLEPSAQGGKPAFDRDALTRLIGEAPEARAEAITLFLRNLQRVEADLGQAIAHQDTTALRETAHRARSSSHAMGAHRLGELLGALESAAREGHGGRADDLVPLICEEAGVVRRCLTDE
ncbi:MAG: response regulator [Hydrogenophaga sp.]|uniref:ATP-binding protein n=1 Tax=Hydrogenophaga sp. TaxID=1904254 RepID=UPI001D264809|nr:ATP-binding protein [Hydrogenophaga sp.]MBX3608791.1 response regulator [Hydrogenophaga sp.]